jgi:hypothetical protein
VGKFGCGIYGFIAALWYRLLCLVGKLCGKVVWESCVGKLCGKVVWESCNVMWVMIKCVFDYMMR